MPRRRRWFPSRNRSPAPLHSSVPCRPAISGKKTAPTLGRARVRHIGVGGVDGTATLLGAIEVNLPSADASAGSLLLDDHGRISGVLAEVHEQDGQVLGDFVPRRQAWRWPTSWPPC